MSCPRYLIPLLLAFLVNAPLPSAAHAQQSTTLPEIRLVNPSGVLIGNMYLCSGVDWESCRTKTAEKIGASRFYSHPEADSLGGRKVSQGEPLDLGGVGSFALFVREMGLTGGEWFMHVVDVRPIPPVVDFDVHTNRTSIPAVGFSVSVSRSKP